MPPQQTGNVRFIDVIDRILRLGKGSEVAVRSGMKTTNVVGYPLFTCWARWGGSEPNQSGTIKAILFLPYVQSGLVSLTKASSGSSMESPIDMVNSHVPNPYNVKANINPFLNVSGLREGEYYNFIITLKPGAFSQGSNTMAYWDAWIMSFAVDPNDAYRPYLGLLSATQKFWEKLKASLNPQYHDPNLSSHEVAGASADNTPQQ
jgi:hypothetical protein